MVDDAIGLIWGLPWCSSLSVKQINVVRHKAAAIFCSDYASSTSLSLTGLRFPEPLRLA